MNKVIVVVGPTGVGKTKMSVELAKKYDGEVINADSTQVYKDLNIATAKIKEEEKEGIPHHLFDIKNIDDVYTVYDYQKDARCKIDEVLKKGKTPILVGGTGLYISAVLYDYDFDIEDSTIQEDVSYEEVLKINPDLKIHPNNQKRLNRYYDYYKKTGKLLDEKKNATKKMYDFLLIGLTMDRSLLYDRINKRVDKMVSVGLIEEAKNLYDKKIFTKATLTPIGYKELFEYFDGNITFDEAIDKIKKKSRNYAKRQYTWFSNKMEVNWFNVDVDNFLSTIEDVEQYINSNF